MSKRKPAAAEKSANPTNSVVKRVDADLAARAYRKVVAGETLTSSERAALKRFEAEREEDRRWEYYESIPQKHWRQMSGRQTKVLNEQAERYGIPFGGRSINLPNVVRALHDFLATHKHRFVAEDDEMMVGGSSPALERYREERAKLAKLDRLEREGKLLQRDVLRAGLARAIQVIRSAGDALQRRFGPGVAEIHNRACDVARDDIKKFFEAYDREHEDEEL